MSSTLFISDCSNALGHRLISKLSISPKVFRIKLPHRSTAQGSTCPNATVENARSTRSTARGSCLVSLGTESAAVAWEVLPGDTTCAGGVICARCPGALGPPRRSRCACSCTHLNGEHGPGLCFPLGLLVLSEPSMRKSPEETSGSNSCA